MTHRLIQSLENFGEDAAANLLREFGSFADSSQELAYRLYDICEKNKWSEDAIGYNSLVISWPDIRKLAQGPYQKNIIQTDIFG